MKKALFLSFLLLIVFNKPTYSQGKSKNKSEEDVKFLLCKKWFLVKCDINGKSGAMGPLEKKIVQIFRADGRFERGFDGDDIGFGKWKYSHKTMTLTINNDVAGEPTELVKIVDITNEQLILLFEAGKNKIKMFMKNKAK